MRWRGGREDGGGEWGGREGWRRGKGGEGGTEKSGDAIGEKGRREEEVGE